MVRGWWLVVSERLFDEMKRYVRFDAEDERILRELGPLLAQDLPAVVDLFYLRIEEHPPASVVIAGGPEQVERLKQTLSIWLREFFAGPWDDAYFDKRCAIGRRHVRINLPQHYNFTAMNLIRMELQRRTLALSGDGRLGAARISAIDKLIDLELAIILHTYGEDHVTNLRRSERLATFGQITSTIGHELRNPLGVIESSLYLLRKRLGDDAAAHRHADKIQAQVGRANRIITNLLDLVRQKAPVRARIAPRVLVEHAVQSVAETRSAQIEVRIAPDVPEVAVDAEQIHQVLRNLLDNAVDAAGSAGSVRVEAAARGTEVEFLVADSGPGVDPLVRGRLFEPLMTTKHSGVGLGLALCRKLVLAHGGVIELIAARELPGAHFAVRLPAAT